MLFSYKYFSFIYCSLLFLIKCICEMISKKEATVLYFVCYWCVKIITFKRDCYKVKSVFPFCCRVVSWVSNGKCTCFNGCIRCKRFVESISLYICHAYIILLFIWCYCVIRAIVNLYFFLTLKKEILIHPVSCGFKSIVKLCFIAIVSWLNCSI